MTGYNNSTIHTYDIVLGITRAGIESIVPIPFAQNVGPTEFDYDQGGNVYVVSQKLSLTQILSLNLRPNTSVTDSLK